MYQIRGQEQDGLNARIWAQVWSVAVREETIMTFHGGARRRSRRAFDTLDAQVNCNRERRGSWLVRSERLNVARLDERDKKRERGWKRRNGSKVHRKEVICDDGDANSSSRHDNRRLRCNVIAATELTSRRTESPRTQIAKKRTIDVAKRWEKVAVKFSATKKRGRINVERRFQ